MYGRKSSCEAEIGRHGVSYYTKSGAYVARVGSVEAIGASRSRISNGVVGTITGVTRGKMSYGNGGTVGSPYAFQSRIQMS